LFDAELSPEQREFSTPIDSIRISWDGTGYIGTLRNVVFESMWQRGYDGKCRFIVDIDDGFGYPQTLEFFKCETDAEAEDEGESTSCMFPSGEANVFVPLEGAPKDLVLVWSPLDIVTLRHRNEPGIECNFPACGDCTCSTRELCLQLTSSDGCLKSEIVNFLANPECPLQELPVWEYNFACGYDVVAGSLRLKHNDETGQCELIHEVPEEYVEQVVVLEECKTIEEEFTWTVGDGDDAITYTLKVRDADCDTCEIPPLIGCCDLDFSTAGCASIPKILYVDINAIGDCRGWDGTCYPLSFSVISSKWVTGCNQSAFTPGGDPCNDVTSPCGCCFSPEADWIPGGTTIGTNNLAPGETDIFGNCGGSDEPVQVWLAMELQCTVIDGQETLVLSFVCSLGSGAGGVNPPPNSPNFTASACVRPVTSGSCAPVVWLFGLDEACCGVSQSGMGFTITEITC
jgi:hypothetical protein